MATRSKKRDKDSLDFTRRAVKELVDLGILKTGTKDGQPAWRMTKLGRAHGAQILAAIAANLRKGDEH